MMKVILHQFLMEKHQLEDQEMPSAIWDKIEIFEDLSAKLERCEEGKAHQLILKQLKELDWEIYYDIHEAFEFELEGHSTEPVFRSGQSVEIVKGKPEYRGIVAHVSSYLPPTAYKEKGWVVLEAPELPDGKVSFEVSQIKRTDKKPLPPTKEEAMMELVEMLEDMDDVKSEEKASKKEKPKSDEAILTQLHKIKHTQKLTRQGLKEMGLKARLGFLDFEVRIGDFLLIRTSLWYYEYRLEKRLSESRQAA